MNWLTAFIIALVLLGVWGVYLEGQSQKACEAQGGVYLRSSSGYVCVDVRKMKLL
jgi:hypothetical protein